MDDNQLDRSIRFAAFLIGGVLFLVFGVQSLVSGVIDWAIECTNQNFNGPCSGNEVWQILSPVFGGVVIIVFAIVFFILAYRSRRSGLLYLPPPP